MFTDKTWITNGSKKVKNPTKIAGTNTKYQGVLNEDYDFHHQTENFNKIKELLEPHQIYGTEIYSAKRVGKNIFTVLFNNPHLMWQKYEGQGFGSGQNYIFYKEHKIKTTLFVDLTPDEINELFIGVAPVIFFQRRNDQNNN